MEQSKHRHSTVILAAYLHQEGDSHRLQDDQLFWTTPEFVLESIQQNHPDHGPVYLIDHHLLNQHPQAEQTLCRVLQYWQRPYQPIYHLLDLQALLANQPVTVFVAVITQPTWISFGQQTITSYQQLLKQTF